MILLAAHVKFVPLFKYSIISICLFMGFTARVLKDEIYSFINGTFTEIVQEFTVMDKILT